MSDNGQLDLVAAQRAVSEFAQELVKQMQPVVLAAAKALQALASDPVVRFAMEHPELLRPPAQMESSCYCLCSAAHPGVRGICDGEAAAVLTRWTSVTGSVDIPVCGSCSVAVGVVTSG